MGNDWPTVRVGDLADSISDTHSLGKAELIFLNTSDVSNGRILHHNYSPVKYWPGQAKKAVRKDDILFSEIRPANRRYAYVDVYADDYVVSTKLMVIRARRDRVFPRFLYSFLTGPQVVAWLQHLAESRSGTFPQITFDQVAELEVSLPPLTDQIRIAAFLDAIANKIELNRKMNETLEAMARALFKSWFVDFDPVRAKAAGCDPGLPRHLAHLFPNSFEESDTAEIPNGWRCSTLAEFALLNPEVWSKEARPAIIRYIDLSNTKKGQIEDVAEFPQAKAPSRAQRILRPNDTVVGTVRPGNASYAYISEEGLTGSTGFAVLRPRKNEYAEFVYLAATADSNIQALAHLADGAAYPAVRPEAVEATPVVAGGPELLGGFANIARPLFRGISLRQRQSRTLAALRDALLPKLISGEIRVKG